MNIIIPCAGAARRFKEEGYEDIKPFIPTRGALMIEWVLKNLICSHINQKFIFLFQRDHIKNNDVSSIIYKLAKKLNIKYELIEINGLTDGSARTTLFAESLIDNSEELVLANSDQFVSNFNVSEFIGYSRGLNLDCGILTFNDTDSKWSFVRRCENSIYIDLVREKEPISNHANVGIFYWKNGCDYVSSVKSMIDKNIRVGSEFYVSPSINELINNEKLVSNYHLNSSYGQKMWGLGTPFDHRMFERYYEAN